MHAILRILSLAAASASALAGSAELYAGTQVIRVPSSNSTQYELIHNIINRLDLSTWKSIPNAFVDVVVPAEQTDAFEKDLEVLKLATEVLHADLGASIAEESVVPEAPKAKLAFNDNARAVLVNDAWFNAYHTYADHMSYLTELAATYPTNSQTFTVGTSVQGKVITGINIFGSGGSGSKPAVVFLGTIHAREWATTPVTEYIAWKLLSETTSKAFLEKYDVYIIPVSNPDGFVYTQTTNRLWRKNRQPAPSGSTCIGVDPNRNFAIKWGQAGGASTSPCAEDYQGTAAASTPEVNAISKFIVSKGASPAGGKLFIDFHSYGNYMLTPYGYSATVPPTDTVIQAAARGYASAVRGVHGTTLTVGPSGITLYPTTGSSDDFSFDVGRFAYTYTHEVRGTNFVLPPAQIRPAVEEVWAGVKFMLGTSL